MFFNPSRKYKYFVFTISCGDRTRAKKRALLDTCVVLHFTVIHEPNACSEKNSPPCASLAFPLVSGPSSNSILKWIIRRVRGQAFSICFAV